MTVERNAFAVRRLELYLVFGGGGCGGDDEFSTTPRWRGGGRGPAQHAQRHQCRRGIHPPQTPPAAVTLFLLNFAAFAITLGAYAPGRARAPDARASRCGWGLGVGQVYVLTRLWIKLTFLGRQKTALFQGRLGHGPATVAARRTGPGRIRRPADAI